MYLLPRSRWGIEAKGCFRCTVTQVHSERMFQASLKVSVFVTEDNAIPGGRLPNKIPKRGCLPNLGIVTLPKIFLEQMMCLLSAVSHDCLHLGAKTKLNKGSFSSLWLLIFLLFFF